jgi:hypothetical protein
VGALHEDDALVFDDDGAHAYQRHFGEFALHGRRILSQGSEVEIMDHKEHEVTRRASNSDFPS